MDIINEIKSQPLDQYDLERMLGPVKKYTRIIQYDQLSKYTLESLFKGVMAVIIFLEIHKENGSTENIGHWIVLLHHDDHYEHFDSYGIGVDEEVSITHEKKDLITKLFQSSKKGFVESQRKLQSSKKDVDTCGRWCVLRIRMANYELPKFYSFIDHINSSPDTAVVALTMFT